MSENNKKMSMYVYVPLILTIIFMVCCFFVEVFSMGGQVSKSNYTVANVSSSNLGFSSGEYEYVEVKDTNGIKYYVLKEPDGVPSDTDVNSEPENYDKNMTVVDAPVQKGRVAYLTFDDGPSENTMQILDILDQYNVKATFFVIYKKGMDKQYKEIVKRGHTIALHSYTHSYKKIYSSEEAYFEDLEKIEKHVESVTGVKTNIMRFPGGSSNTVSNKYSKGLMKKLKEDVPEHGYIYHDWNVDSTDASGINVPAETLVKKVENSLTKYKNADILMHDSGVTKQTTVEALPEIIEFIRSQGYKMESITDETSPVRHNW